MPIRPIAAGVLILVVVVARLGAIMLGLDVRKVPIDRLLANLERLAKEDPLNPQPQINLARLHVMAYALKQDTLDAAVRRGGDDKTEIPYFPSGGGLPDTVRPAPTADHEARAVDHLKRAIQHYDNALKLGVDHTTALLGRGWARKEAGDTAGAIADLRRAIAVAWPEESKTKMLMPNQRFITSEAIGYLVPLLDPQRDAVEIADLRSKQTDLKNRPRAITPIAVPLDDHADVTSIVDSRARVRFDADGSALDRDWTWITPRAGWLVYDHEGRGQITSALQLFGNVTFWLFWSNGYDAMAALDDDGNGRLEANELRQLAIWRDINGNGRSDEGEVAPLSSHGIAALSFDHVEGDGERIAALAPRGVTMRDGRTRPTYDIILRHAGSAFTN